MESAKLAQSMKSAKPAQPEKPPANLIVAGRYEIIRELGAGGMGTVYLVRHVNTDERLAMKVLRKEVANQAEAVERFKREMKASAILKSEHVTRITDADTAAELDGALYMVMELLDGGDVERITRDGKLLDPSSVVFILAQASRALEKAHALGIIHRDLKPENLFLHRSEEFGLMVKVLDFGIAMFQTRFGNAEFRLTQDNSLLGTPLYMAPEQVLGNRDDISPQTDIWAIGMIVFDMLTGQAYWRVPNLGVLLSKIALGDMPAPSTYAPALPKAFDDWFARSCAHDRNNRFSSVREQIEALVPALAVDPVWLDSPAAPPALQERVNLISPVSEPPVLPRLTPLPRSLRAGTGSSSTGSNATASPSESAEISVSKPATPDPKPATPEAATPAPAVITQRSQKRWLVLVIVLLIPLCGGGLLLLARQSDRSQAVAAQPGVITPQTPKVVPPPAPSAIGGTDKADAVASGADTETEPRPHKRTHAKSKGKSEVKPDAKHDAKPDATIDGKTLPAGRPPRTRPAIDYDPVAP